MVVWIGFYVCAGLLAEIGPLVAYISPPFVLLALTAAVLATAGTLRRLPVLFRWPGGVSLLAGVGLGAALWLVGTTVAILEQRLMGAVQGNNPLLLRPGLFVSPVHLVLFVGVAALLAPLAEELFYRGLFYAWLRDRLPVTAAAAASGLVFAAAHMVPSLILPLALVGWGLAILYERARSLWPVIAAHALFNLLSLVLAYAWTHG